MAWMMPGVGVGVGRKDGDLSLVLPVEALDVEDGVQDFADGGGASASRPTA